jgi:two-component system, chemotaxis family, protein-glutamate methylesterase/glutaminase
MKMIKVLIVEDSMTAQVLLKQVLTQDPHIEVIGTAKDGMQALEFLRHSQPDIVTMDLHMPVMDGLETTRRIMETNPVPIVIVSGSWNSSNKADAFDFLEAGALAALEKPQRVSAADYDDQCKELVQTVKLMSEIKVVKRFPASARRHREKQPHEEDEHPGIRLVVIGASTGGPPVLKTILSAISKDFPVPIVIVQHIAKGFLQGLADWLDASCDLSVKIGKNGQEVLPGHVYLAPDGYELGVSRPRRIHLSVHKGSHFACPSVSYLFRSAAINFGWQSVGILLSGMGRDGADELFLMKQKGAVTIAQDKDSCVVYGMPGAAVKLHGATHVLAPEKIAPTLERVVSASLHRKY